MEKLAKSEENCIIPSDFNRSQTSIRSLGSLHQVLQSLILFHLALTDFNLRVRTNSLILGEKNAKRNGKFDPEITQLIHLRALAVVIECSIRQQHEESTLSANQCAHGHRLAS
jgi:hypothetical protein